MLLSESITNSYVQFAELKLRTVDRCSSANCTNEFPIGAVHRTAAIIIVGARAQVRPRNTYQVEARISHGKGQLWRTYHSPLIEHRKYPACGYSQLHSMGSSSDAAIRCQYCSNLLLLALAASSSECLCVGLVSARPSICPPVCLSRRSIDICRRQKAVAASLLHCDPKDED